MGKLISFILSKKSTNIFASVQRHGVFPKSFSPCAYCVYNQNPLMSSLNLFQFSVIIINCQLIIRISSTTAVCCRKFNKGTIVSGSRAPHDYFSSHTLPLFSSFYLFISGFLCSLIFRLLYYLNFFQLYQPLS